MVSARTGTPHPQSAPVVAFLDAPAALQSLFRQLSRLKVGTGEYLPDGLRRKVGWFSRLTYIHRPRVPHPERLPRILRRPLGENVNRRTKCMPELLRLSYSHLAKDA